MRRHLSQLDMAILVFCAVVAIFAASVPAAVSATEEEPTYIESLNGMVEENTYHPVVAVERPSVAQQKMLEMYACDDAGSENDPDASPTGEAKESTGIQEENATEPPTVAPIADSVEVQASEQTDAEESPLPDESPTPQSPGPVSTQKSSCAVTRSKSTCRTWTGTATA